MKHNCKTVHHAGCKPAFAQWWKGLMMAFVALLAIPVFANVGVDDGGGAVVTTYCTSTSNFDNSAAIAADNDAMIPMGGVGMAVVNNNSTTVNSTDTNAKKTNNGAGNITINNTGTVSAVINNTARLAFNVDAGSKVPSSFNGAAPNNAFGHGINTGTFSFGAVGTLVGG